MAQTLKKPFGIVPDFVRNNTSQKLSEVASNVLRVTNNTGTRVSFHLRFSVPQGWQIISSSRQQQDAGGSLPLPTATANYSLAPGDSVFIPVRVIIDKQAKGNTNYVLTAFLVSDKDVTFASQNWYTGIESRPDWSAAILLKKLYFINGIDTSGFSIHFQNSGNADENIHLNFRADHRLEILSGSKQQQDAGSPLPLPTATVLYLPVGADTVLNFAVRKRQDFLNDRNKKDLEERLVPSNEQFIVQASAQSEGALGRPGQSWTGTATFYKLGNMITKNEFKGNVLPLTFDMNIYDILSNATTMSLDAYGSTGFSNDRLLNYRFQTIFVTNFLDERSFLGNNHYIGYFTRRGSVEAGEVSGWGHSMIFGQGLKAILNFHANNLGFIFTESPRLFTDKPLQSFGLYHHLEQKKFSISNYYSHIVNDALFFTNNLYSTTASVRLNTRNQFTVGGGYSTEAYATPAAPLRLSGYGYELNYSYGYKKLSLNLADQFGSPDYTLARGVSMISGRASYYIDAAHNVSFTGQNFVQKAPYYFNGVIYPGAYVRADRYEFRFGFISPASAVYLKPLRTMDDNYSLHVITNGLGMEYNARNLTSMRLSANLFMGYADAVGYNMPQFFISHFSANARWNSLNVNLHYFYGPNQTAEQLRFIQDQINPQSLTLNSSYDLWFGRSSWLLTTTSSLIYQTYFDKTTFLLKPELFYYTRSGFRLSMYFTWYSSKQASNPIFTNSALENQTFTPIVNNELNMGFGIKKQIGIPVPGKSFKSVKVVVFKDYNGNRTQDKNEDGAENILVNIRFISPATGGPDSMGRTATNADSSYMENTHGEDFITNNKGEILYNNVPAGTYRIKIMPLVHLGQWFDGKEEDILIDGKQKVITMPLSKGVKVSGNILIARDKYTGDKQDIDLSRIRITAIDSAGKTYSALTDQSGSYSMYLPNGIYTISMNESALSDNFECLQNKLFLDLTKPINDNYSITFNVAERKREMKIKKFNSNGEEMK